MHFRQMQAAELGERCTLYHKVGKVAGMAGKPQPSGVARMWVCGRNFSIEQTRERKMSNHPSYLLTPLRSTEIG